MSNQEVKKIDLEKIMKSRDEMIQYREILPELMDVSIDKDYNMLGCNNDCASCQGCKDVSAVKYDKERRKIVLAQLEKLEKEYFFS